MNYPEVDRLAYCCAYFCLYASVWYCFALCGLSRCLRPARQEHGDAGNNGEDSKANWQVVEDGHGQTFLAPGRRGGKRS